MAGGVGHSWFEVELTSEDVPIINPGDGGVGNSWFAIELTSEDVPDTGPPPDEPEETPLPPATFVEWFPPRRVRDRVRRRRPSPVLAEVRRSRSSIGRPRSTARVQASSSTASSTGGSPASRAQLRVLIPGQSVETGAVRSNATNYAHVRASLQQRAPSTTSAIDKRDYLDDGELIEIIPFLS